MLHGRVHLGVEEALQLLRNFDLVLLRRLGPHPLEVRLPLFVRTLLGRKRRRRFGGHQELAVLGRLRFGVLQGLGDAFTPQVKDAWAKVYGVIAKEMIDAAGYGSDTDQQVALVQRTFAQMAASAEQAGAMFYGQLFEIRPDVKPLFTGDIGEQGKKFMEILEIAVNGLDNIEKLLPAIKTLGARHRGFGVKTEDYEDFGTALFWTLEQNLGDAFTPEVHDAWASIYSVLSEIMLEGAEEYGDVGSEAE